MVLNGKTSIAVLSFMQTVVSDYLSNSPKKHIHISINCLQFIRFATKASYINLPLGYKFLANFDGACHEHAEDVDVSRRSELMKSTCNDI